MLSSIKIIHRYNNAVEHGYDCHSFKLSPFRNAQLGNIEMLQASQQGDALAWTDYTTASSQWQQFAAQRISTDATTQIEWE